MSLILEALRKSEAERRRGTPPQLLDPPLAPSSTQTAPASTRGIPASGLAAIATALIVLLGMTGYRMFVAPGDDDVASTRSGVSTEPMAGADAAASTASIDAASPRATMRAPASVLAQTADTRPASTGAAIDPASPAPPAATIRMPGSPASLEPARPTARVDTGGMTGATQPPGVVASAQPPGTPPSRSMPATASTTGSTTGSPGHADRIRPKPGTTPALPMPIAADSSTEMTTATPAPSAPTGGADRPVASARAPTAPPAPSPRSTLAASSAPADRPVRLADLAPADRRALPPLRMSMHLFAAIPADRFVILDGQRVSEGDRVGEAVVDEITADGAVLAWRGQRVRVSVR
jgi:general secretion pathway protein B